VIRHASLPRPCTWLLRSAAWLAPADLRRDWLREWEAEIAFAITGRAHTRAKPTNVWLTMRCGGACVHAAWLRWDRWRIEMLWQDIKYAIRGLIKRPAFAAMTILTLAVGIGGNAAIFSAVRAVLLRPLPFPSPGELVQLSSTSTRAPEAVGGSASPPDFVDWRQMNRSFADIAAINAGSYALTRLGSAEQLPGAQVTGGFFNVLAVPAMYGRTLLPEDDATGGPDVAVLSHALWSRRFGADPSVIGRTIVLDGTDYRVVGVMPRGFAYPLESEIWLPQRFTTRELTTQRGAHYLDVIGRRKPDVSLEQAREDMRAIAMRLAQQYPSYDRNQRIAVHEMRSALVGQVRTALLLLLGAVGFVLLIVCVNVANLVLTRALGRSRELAVRTALGAGRFRLVRGVLVESGILAVAGGVTGLVVAFWASQGIASLEEGLHIPLLGGTRIDGTVVIFTMVVSAAAAILFGSLPAWQSAAIGDVAGRIREESGTSTGDRGRQRLRGALIVCETALAVVLLVGAGLLLRSFFRMSAVDLGFDSANVQTFNVSLPAMTYQQPAQRAAFVETLVTRAAHLPGVTSAGAIFGLPLTDFAYSISMSTLDGRRLQDDEQDARSLQVRVVTPDYFKTMTIPVVRGRSLSGEDRLGAAPAIVVNETAAARLWPGESAIGHEFTLGTRMGQGGPDAGGAVVGVVHDVHDFGPVQRIRPTVYLAHAQFPMGFMTVTLKTQGDPSATIAPLRALMAELDRDLPIFRVRSMEQIAGDSVAQPRVYLLLLGLFAGVAVLLAALGIYGVLMHAVAQRTREIGIRLALGAARTSVVTMVVRQAAVLAVAGLALGLALSLGASRLLTGLLFGITPTDALTYAVVAAGLLAVALLASYLPARRASRIDPIRALRYD